MDKSTVDACHNKSKSLKVCTLSSSYLSVTLQTQLGLSLAQTILASLSWQPSFIKSQWLSGLHNLFPEQVKVVNYLQFFKCLLNEHRHSMAFYAGELGLLQSLTELVSVPQDHLRKEQTE